MNFNFLDKNLDLNGVVNKYIKGAGTKDADFLTKTIFEGGRKTDQLEIDHVVSASGFGGGTQEILNQAWTDEMTIGKSFSGDVTSTKTFFDELDEPTYLTFKIAFGGPFTPVEPIHIASYAYKDIETYGGNMLKNGNMDHFPHPLLVSPEYDIEGFRGRRRHEEGTYSTYSYLLDSNNGRRAVMLYEFQKGLHELQSKYQFYFQSISGLGKLLTTSMDGQRVKKDAVIKIKCLNSIDQKVKYLLQLYKQICYDEMYQRWILPDMMRYFKLYIFISEVKRFHGTDRIVNEDKTVHSEYSNDKGDIGGAMEEGVLRAMNSIAPVTCIECSMCEFDITQSLYDDNYSINPEEPHSGLEIPIKVGKVTIHERYPIFADVIVPVTKDFIDEYIINFRDRNLDNVSSKDMTNAARDLGLIDTEYFNSTPADHKEGKLHQTGGKRVSKWVYNLMRWGVARGHKQLTDIANKWLLKPIRNGVNLLDLENAFNSKDSIIAFGVLKKLIKGTTESYQVPDSIQDTIFKDTIKFLASNKGDDGKNELADMAETILKDQTLYDTINDMSDEELFNKIIDSNKLSSNKPEDFNLDKVELDGEHKEFPLAKGDLKTSQPPFSLSEVDKDTDKQTLNLPKPILDLIKHNIGLGKLDLDITKSPIDMSGIEPDEKVEFDMTGIEPDEKVEFDMTGIEPDEKIDFDLYGIEPDEKIDFDLYGIEPDEREDFDLYGIEPEEREDFDLYGIEPDEREDFEMYGIEPDERESFEMYKNEQNTDKIPFELIEGDDNTDKIPFELIEGDDNTDKIPFNLSNIDNSNGKKSKLGLNSVVKELIRNNIVNKSSDTKGYDINSTRVKQNTEKSSFEMQKGDSNTEKPIFEMLNGSKGVKSQTFEMQKGDSNTEKHSINLSTNLKGEKPQIFDLPDNKNTSIKEDFDLPDNKNTGIKKDFDLPDNKNVGIKEDLDLPDNKNTGIKKDLDLPKIKQEIDLDDLKDEFMTIFNSFNKGPNAKVKPFKLEKNEYNTDKEEFEMNGIKKEEKPKMEIKDQKSTGEKEDMKLSENKQTSEHVSWEMDKMGNVTVVDPVDISKNYYDK